MQRFLLAAAVLCGLAAHARAADTLTLQLKWVPQAQFAGYYVAAAKGFYAEAGLDVTTNRGGPDIRPAPGLARGGADVIVDWMPSALAERDKGVPLVNIAQVFETSGMELTCRRDSGVSSPAQFKGHTLGVWFSGNEYPFLAWMAKLKLPISGGPDGVTVLKQDLGFDPLLRKQAACISTMSYNGYWQLIEAGMTADQLQVFRYEDQGVATLEDGLYTTERKLADPAAVAVLARFLRASLKGWQYAAAHQDEAVQVVLANDTAGTQTAAHQKRMMGDVAKLLGADPKRMGYLDPAAYDRTVDELMASGGDPVITRKPAGAWSHAVFDAASR